ncbi:MAG: septum formation initiator family protein [Actinomycetota bacterium]|nr:septum formation initiator family protein [Actinomycetota bacterium]
MEPTLWIKIRARRKRRNFVIWTFMLLCFLYIVGDMVFSDMGYLKYRQLLGRRLALQTKIAQTEKENQHIEKSLSQFAKNDFYKEKLAREDYGRARQGEYVFIFENGVAAPQKN